MLNLFKRIREKHRYTRFREGFEKGYIKGRAEISDVTAYKEGYARGVADASRHLRKAYETELRHYKQITVTLMNYVDKLKSEQR